MTLNNIKLTREKYDIIAKNRGIKEPEKMSTKSYEKPLADMIVNVKHIALT